MLKAFLLIVLVLTKFAQNYHSPFSQDYFRRVRCYGNIYSRKTLQNQHKRYFQLKINFPEIKFEDDLMSGQRIMPYKAPVLIIDRNYPCRKG